MTAQSLIVGFAEDSHNRYVGKISVSELEDFLTKKGACVIRAAKDRKKFFTWCLPNSKHINCPDTLGALPKGSTVVCVEAEIIESLLASNLDIFFIVVQHDGASPCWPLNHSAEERTIIVRYKDSAETLSELVQSLFISNLLCENNLDYLVHSQARIGELIEASSELLGRFVCTTDTGFNLIVCSSKNAPPNSVYSTLFKTGKYPQEEIDYLKSALKNMPMKRTVLVCEPHGDNTLTTLHYPLFIDGSYVFHVTMPLNPEDNVEAAVQRFIKFSRRAHSIFRRFWAEKNEVESSCHKVLIRLIEKKRVPRDYLADQLNNASIQPSGFYRLACFHLEYHRSHIENYQIISEAKTIKKKGSHVFVYGNDLLILFFSTLEAGVSLDSTIRGLSKNICEKFGVTAGISQSFSDIKDINYAYQQTVEALRIKSVVKEAYEYDSSLSGKCAALPFEYALPFILFKDDASKDLIDFSRKNSILSKLEKEDEKHGTEIVPLLWKYLLNERNASAAAAVSSMHRNTIVYHIKKIENQYGLSFESPMVRNGLLFDYICRFGSLE